MALTKPQIRQAYTEMVAISTRFLQPVLHLPGTVFHFYEKDDADKTIEVNVYRKLGEVTLDKAEFSWEITEPHHDPSRPEFLSSFGRIYDQSRTHIAKSLASYHFLGANYVRVDYAQYQHIQPNVPVAEANRRREITSVDYEELWQDLHFAGDLLKGRTILDEARLPFDEF